MSVLNSVCQIALKMILSVYISPSRMWEFPFLLPDFFSNCESHFIINSQWAFEALSCHLVCTSMSATEADYLFMYLVDFHFVIFPYPLPIFYYVKCLILKYLRDMFISSRYQSVIHNVYHNPSLPNMLPTLASW